MEQRSCLFWVVQLISLQERPQELISLLAVKLGGSYNVECISSILQCLAENCVFAFFPSIPKLSQTVVAESTMGLSPDDQTLFSYPSFSMRVPFSQLHGQGKEEGRFPTDLSSLKAFYACADSFSEPHISIQECVRWNRTWELVVKSHMWGCLLRFAIKSHM